MDPKETNPPEPIELPITGELDLHTFRPQDIRELVPDYLQVCRQRGVLEVRVVHGKGHGQLARSVHAILARLPEVESYAAEVPAYSTSEGTVNLEKPAHSRGEKTSLAILPRQSADFSAVNSRLQDELLMANAAIRGSPEESWLRHQVPSFRIFRNLVAGSIVVPDTLQPRHFFRLRPAASGP